MILKYSILSSWLSNPVGSIQNTALPWDRIGFVVADVCENGNSAALWFCCCSLVCLLSVSGRKLFLRLCLPLANSWWFGALYLLFGMVIKSCCFLKKKKVTRLTRDQVIYTKLKEDEILQKNYETLICFNVLMFSK